MSHKPVVTESEWAATVEKFDLTALINEARSVRNCERAVTLMVRLMLACGDLARALGVPRITGHRFEFPVSGGAN